MHSHSTIFALDPALHACSGKSLVTDDWLLSWMEGHALRVPVHAGFARTHATPSRLAAVLSRTVHSHQPLLLRFVDLCKVL